jgi:hypothetical protein
MVGSVPSEILRDEHQSIIDATAVPREDVVSD